MKISRRALSIPPSPIRKLMPFAEQAKQKGIHIYHLNIGQPDIKTPKKYIDNLTNLNLQVIKYETAKGNQEFRKGLLYYYQTFGIKNLNIDNFQVTTGGSEALLFAMATICDSGDEIIIFEPFYANYNGIAKMLNIKLVPITLKAEDAYHIPSQKIIEKFITPKTRAILICSPNNPTGTVYTDKELQRIISIAYKHNLFILADEVYREFIYTKQKPNSLLNYNDPQNRIIVLDSLSKRFSLCGARLGCLVTRNKEILEYALRMAQARLSSPLTAQIAATKLLYFTKEYYKKIVSEYNNRRKIILESLCNFHKDIIYHEPLGSFYLFVKLPIKDTDHFAKWMLTDFSYQKQTTMVAPGNGFYVTPGKGKDEIRIAYVLQTDKLKKAMHILKMGLEKYLKIFK